MKDPIAKKAKNIKSPHVVMVAYACAPDWPSEPGVGWNFAQQMVASYNLTVLTRNRYKELIEAAPDKGINYLYYELPKWLLALEFKIPMGEQLYYFIWQWCAYIWLRKYLKKQPKKADLLHHLNFGTTWITPSAFLIDLPIVWGPLGGPSAIPWSFLKRLGIKAFFRESVYYVINLISYISPQSKWMRIKTDAILFRSKCAEESFVKTPNTIRKVISETAAPLSMVYAGEKEFKTEINALCIGRLNYWKGYRYAVRGFHTFLKEGGKGTLTIFGKGEDELDMKAYIQQHDLGKSIFLKGHVPNEVVKQQLVDSTVMMHPSFRDGGSWAIMEAMAFGLPVICLDTSGPRDMVTHNCGFMLPLDSPEQVIRDIATSLHKLSSDVSMAAQLSTNARNRIRDFYNWQFRGEQLAEIYEEVLAKHKNKKQL